MPFLTRLRNRLPSAEKLTAHPLTRPLAPWLTRPGVWHFNRHTVARGVAVGLFFGLLVPVAQIAFAAVGAIALRANVAVAALATLVTNPLTFPPIYYGAWRLGDWLLGSDSVAAGAAVGAWSGSWFDRGVDWLLDAAPSLGLGLAVLAVGSAVIGYAAVHLAWRTGVVMRRRRSRQSS